MTAFSVGAIGVAGRLEQTRIGFTTLLGSAAKADTMLRNLATFAKSTPFELTGLEVSTKRLLAYGFTAEQVIPTLTAVGNATAALGGGQAVIDRITLALGQMQAKGKVSGEEMRQLAEAGIPAWQILADTIGVSIPEAMDKAQQGAIPASVAITAMIEGMSARFGGMMEAQSKTMLGQWSNLKDEVELVMRDIGASLLPAATTFVAAGRNVVHAWSALPPVLKSTIAVGGGAAGVIALVGGSVLLLASALPSAIAGLRLFSVAFAFVKAEALIAAAGGVTTLSLSLGALAASAAAAALPVIAVVGSIALIAVSLESLGRSIKQWTSGEHVTSFSENLKDMWSSLSGAVMPTMDLSGATSQLQAEMGKANAESLAFARTLMDQIAGGADTATASLATAADEVDAFTASLFAINRAGPEFDSLFQGFLARTGDANAAFALASRTITEDLDTSLEDLSKHVQDGERIWAAYTSGIITQEQAYNLLHTATERVTEATDALAVAAKGVQDRFMATLPAINAMGPAFGSVVDAFEQMGFAAGQAFDLAVLKVSTDLPKALQVLAEQAGPLGETIVAGIQSGLITLGDGIARLEQITGESLSGVMAHIDEVQTKFDGFLTFARNMTADGGLTRVFDSAVLRTRSLDQLTQMVQTGGNSAMLTLAGQASETLKTLFNLDIPDQLEAYKKWFKEALLRILSGGTDLKGIPGFAAGVQNFRGGMAVVGERGPELVRLPRGADVISNRDLQATPAVVGAGGRTVNNLQVTVDMRGAVVYGEMDFDRRVQRAVRDGLLGGGFRDLPGLRA